MSSKLVAQAASLHSPILTTAKLVVLLLIALLPVATANAAETHIERIETTPRKVKLSGERDATQVLVTGFATNGDTVDLTRDAKFGEASVVEIKSGYVRAKQDGSETMDVRIGDLRTQLQVTVQQAEEPRPISFRWETLAVLTKQGCNSGACHGKPNGRGALELSLNAFDPKLDERSLVRGSFVRFTEPLAPTHSLMLKKPTLRVPHGGGKRLRENDRPYEILKQWIYEGCQTNLESAPSCVKVEIQPPSRVIRLADGGGQQQTRVIAHFSDGTVRDVTRIATYSLSNDAVANVDPHGLVSGTDRGQTAVVVRYLDDIVSAYFTFVRDVPEFEWNNPPASNYVDELVHNKLRQLQYQPSAKCDDATFLRRLSLDVRGLLPTAEEAADFLDDGSPDKRQKLIDQFLDSPKYARYWGLKMADLLRINREHLSPDQASAYSQWVFESVESNMPYDRFVTELLTANGSTAEVQPANFFRVTSDTKMVAETVAQLFMGSRILCAQCHNHPYESWTQDNYYQIASVFHEVDRKLADGSKKKQLPAPGEGVTISLTAGRAMSNPRTGIEQQPWPTDVKRAADEDKRVAFVEWLTSADNAYFSRVAVNRIWSHLMGRGLVEPIDDFRSSNPAVNVELIDALAKNFAESGFDRKHIMRVILNSQTYQRSSDTNKLNETDGQLFSHARVRLLSAEQLQDAITRLSDGGALEQPAGSQYMTQQPYPHLTTFLKAFGQPQRKTACACERRDEASLDQALQLMNSELIRNQVTRARERLHTLPGSRIVEQLYLSAFSRPPRPKERATVLRHLEAAADRNQAIEDVVWALINTNEFMFQH